MPISPVLANNVPRDVDGGTFPVPAVSTAGKQTMILQLAPSWDYWYTLLTDVNGNLTQAMIQEIRVKANNKPIITIAGVDLLAQNTEDKVPAILASQILIPYGRFGVLGGANFINFDAKKYLSGASKDLTLMSTLNCGSIGSNGDIITQLSIEIDFVNTPAGSISLHCLSVATPPAPGGPGTIRRIEKKTISAQAGVNIITRQNFALGDAQHVFLNRLHMVTPAGALSAWLVRYNNSDWINRSTAEMNALQKIFNAKAGNAGQNFFLDFLERGYGDESLFIGDDGTDFQLQFTESATELVTVYQDTNGGL